MTKTPIEPGDIRKGDLIRWERIEYSAVRANAVEYTAERDRDSYGHPMHASWFLLYRPNTPIMLPVAPGFYTVSPDAHPYERILVLRGKGWHHLFTPPLCAAEVDRFTPEEIARSAAKDGGLTRLEPVAETAKRVIDRMASWWEFGPPKNWQSEFDDIAKDFGVVTS